jgi:hypothetical protein
MGINGLLVLWRDVVLSLDHLPLVMGRKVRLSETITQRVCLQLFADECRTCKHLNTLTTSGLVPYYYYLLKYIDR